MCADKRLYFTVSLIHKHLFVLRVLQSKYCPLSWRYFCSFVCFVCMCVCGVDSRAGFYLYTSQIYSHTHFMSHGNSKAFSRRSVPSLLMKQCFEKTLKQHRPAIHHLTGWSFIKKCDKVLWNTWHFWNCRCSLACCSKSSLPLSYSWSSSPFLFSSLLSFLFCLIFVCTVLCRLSVTWPCAVTTQICVIHGLMSDSHKPLCSSVDYMCVSPGIQCNCVHTHRHTEGESLLQFQVLQLQYSVHAWTRQEANHACLYNQVFCVKIPIKHHKNFWVRALSLLCPTSFK